MSAKKKAFHHLDLSQLILTFLLKDVFDQRRKYEKPNFLE